MVELFLTLNSGKIEVGAVDVDLARLLIELLLKSNEEAAVTSTVVEVFIPIE